MEAGVTSNNIAIYWGRKNLKINISISKALAINMSNIWLGGNKYFNILQYIAVYCNIFFYNIL
jgi:hypothetical protein